MTKKEAVIVIYEIINSGIIHEELEENLMNICCCIEGTVDWEEENE